MQQGRVARQGRVPCASVAPSWRATAAASLPAAGRGGARVLPDMRRPLDSDATQQGRCGGKGMACAPPDSGWPLDSGAAEKGRCLCAAAAHPHTLPLPLAVDPLMRRHVLHHPCARLRRGAAGLRGSEERGRGGEQLGARHGSEERGRGLGREFVRHERGEVWERRGREGMGSSTWLLTKRGT